MSHTRSGLAQGQRIPGSQAHGKAKEDPLTDVAGLKLAGVFHDGRAVKVRTAPDSAPDKSI